VKQALLDMMQSNELREMDQILPLPTSTHMLVAGNTPHDSASPANSTTGSMEGTSNASIVDIIRPTSLSSKDSILPLSMLGKCVCVLFAVSKFKFSFHSPLLLVQFITLLVSRACNANATLSTSNETKVQYAKLYSEPQSRHRNRNRNRKQIFTQKEKLLWKLHQFIFSDDVEIREADCYDDEHDTGNHDGGDDVNKVNADISVGRSAKRQNDVQVGSEPTSDSNNIYLHDLHRYAVFRSKMSPQDIMKR
jgi:hypothetical protein